MLCCTPKLISSVNGRADAGINGGVGSAEYPQQRTDFLWLGDSILFESCQRENLRSQRGRISEVKIASLQEMAVARPATLQNQSGRPKRHHETEARLQALSN